MWRINNISCENFISFKSAELEIPQYSCTLIYGLNLDNESQRNNGTGKSSIVEAIAFALTGEPLRAVEKTEEIINDNAEDATVRISLDNDYDNSQLTITRTVHRKASQEVTVKTVGADGVDKAVVMPSVLDYNRYILDTLGLTKDDIYSNFILSKNRYKSFFDASDKTKKAMINRFSGADMVDQSIAKLEEDLEPIEASLVIARENKISVESKVEVIQNQINDADLKREEWDNEKKRKIEVLESQKALKREELRNINDTIKRSNERLDKIDEVGGLIEDMEESNKTFAVCYQKMVKLFEEYRLTPLKDYLSTAEQYQMSISSLNEQKKDLEKQLRKLRQSSEKAFTRWEEVKIKSQELKAENESLDRESRMTLADITQDIRKADEQIKQYNDSLIRLRGEYDMIDREIRNLNNQLAGTVTCPQCKHEFFVDADVTVDEVKQSIADKKDAMEKKEGEIASVNENITSQEKNKTSFEEEKIEVNSEIAKRADLLSEILTEVREASYVSQTISTDISNMEHKIKSTESQIQNDTDRLENIRKNMFADAIDIIDNAIDKGEAYVKTLEDKKVSVKSSIETFEESIENIKNSSQDDYLNDLHTKLKEFQKDLDEKKEVLDEITEKQNVLVLQKNYFTDFRSYLANKKVEAISFVTNHFLELIGSDLRVEMVGFKKLKSGKIRDKITVNLLRNGVPCGSYARHSGGERARVNLASILGLKQLTNMSADEGKGLDILVLDEILEASDTSGIESVCQALNKLRVTSLLITQNPIADNAEKITIIKENGYSTISK